MELVNPTITAVWQSNYFGIYRANKVINNVEPVSDIRKQIIAEANYCVHITCSR